MALKVSNGLLFASLAGFFAALASIFAKLTFDSHYIQLCICEKNSVTSYLLALIPSSLDIEAKVALAFFKCENVAILLRILCGLMILLSNALMFRSFSKSLLLCDSAAEATITNTATNFCISGIFGWMLFNERFSQVWLIGISLIISGLAVVHCSKEVTEEGDLSNKTK